jgi:hypothetical protein
MMEGRRQRENRQKRLRRKRENRESSRNPHRPRNKGNGEYKKIPFAAPPSSHPSTDPIFLLLSTRTNSKKNNKVDPYSRGPKEKTY